MRKTFLGHGAALLLCFTTSNIASASIVLPTDNNPRPDFNLLLIAGQTGTTIQSELKDPANPLINLTRTDPPVSNRDLSRANAAAVSYGGHREDARQLFWTT